MHCYVSPQLNVLVQHCKPHHVNTSVYFGKPEKNDATHRYKASMPFPTSVPMRKTQPNISYTNIAYTNTNATLQLTISKRELYTKDSF